MPWFRPRPRLWPNPPPPPPPPPISCVEIIGQRISNARASVRERGLRMGFSKGFAWSSLVLSNDFPTIFARERALPCVDVIGQRISNARASVRERACRTGCFELFCMELVGFSSDLANDFRARQTSACLPVVCERVSLLVISKIQNSCGKP